MSKNAKGSKTGFERLELVRVLELVGAALAGTDLIPVMTHYWLNNGTVSAYNDRIAIEHPLLLGTGEALPLAGAVPGSILGLLKSSHASHVNIEPHESGILVKAAGTRAKLPLLEPDHFMGLFEMPKVTKKSKALSLDLIGQHKEFCEALELCLKSVGGDVGNPEYLGVTVLLEDGWLKLYSTNNYTVTNANVEYPVDESKRFILSGEFCKVYLQMFKKSSPKSFYVSDDYVVVTSDENVKLFGKLIQATYTTDFPGVLRNYLPKNYKKKAVDVPDRLDGIIDRSIVMMDQNDAGLTISSSKSSSAKLVFTSTSRMGEVRDVLTVGEHPQCLARFNPKHLKVGLSNYKQMLITDRAAIFLKDEGCFLVSAYGG